MSCKVNNARNSNVIKGKINQTSKIPMQFQRQQCLDLTVYDKLLCKIMGPLTVSDEMRARRVSKVRPALQVKHYLTQKVTL